MRCLTAVSLILLLLGQGCAAPEPKAVLLKLPEAYANVQRLDGAYVAARAWNHEEQAREAFGFNINRAGLLPVQVSFDNRGSRTLAIVPSQTFLINQNQELFPVLPEQEAYDRLGKVTRLEQGVKGFGQGGLLGGATGALIGAAVGVVAGGSAGEAALRGLAVGATSGAVMGAFQGATNPQVPRPLAQDLARRELKNTSIKPGQMAYGLILFPREAGKPQALRLQLQDQDTGQLHTLTLNLQLSGG